MSGVPTRQQIDDTGRLMARARSVLAYGGLDGIVQRPLFHSADGVFPQFAVSARGCHFEDSTGQTYVDWVIGWGPVMLGYRHPEVEAALHEQLAAGPHLSLMHPIEVEVAEALSSMVPCAEMVAFGKNGSDALTGAVRVARAVTGRDVILQYGMHGFQDWYAGQLAHVRGIPERWRELVAAFPYDDLPALEKLFAEHRGRVAAVVMEPLRDVMPRPGYLQAVKELAHEHGALLVYDEVMTALRLGPGGAQQMLGVVPDVACLGKSMGNGMPLSAIVGRREYMQHLPSVGFGMTFRGETLSFAAARVVLRIVREEPVAAHLARIGEALRKGFRELCARHAIRWDLVGPPARMSVRFAGGGALDAETLRDLFLQECLKRGVFTNGNFLPSYAHDDAAVAETLRGIDGALAVVNEAIQARPSSAVLDVGGFPNGPRAHIAQGFLESLGVGAQGIHLAGWLLLQDASADRIEVHMPDGSRTVARTVERADLEKAYAGRRAARMAGFAASVPCTPGSELDFTLVALRGDRVAFRCRVVRRHAEGGLASPMWLGGGVLYI